MHWTYREASTTSHLSQGDIIRPNDAFRRVLAEVHPWFCNPKYSGFMLLTQSCDLVTGRGNAGPCKASHISIAPIRPLRQVLPALLHLVCTSYCTNVFDSRSKSAALQLLDRIVNQNETALGLFYLHPDSLLFAEECVATMRVSISLRSNDHYDTIRSARIGALNPEFTARLGWMIGNLYSRIGVPDWRENSDKADEAESLMKSLLEDLKSTGIDFVDSRKFEKQVRSGQLTLSGLTDAEVKSLLAEVAGRSFIDMGLDAVKRALQDRVDGESIAKVIGALRSDPEFRLALKEGRE